MILDDDLKKFLPFIKFARKSIADHLGVEFDLIYSDNAKALESTSGSFVFHIIPSRKLFGEGFLKPSSLPKSVDRMKIKGEEVPVLFSSGQPFIEFDEGKLATNIDLIETYFFFLSLYEEVALKERDKLGRFPEDLSFIKSSGLYEIPVLDVIRKVVLEILGKEIKGSSEFYITHDIDRLRTRYSFRHAALKATKLRFKPLIEYFKDLIVKRCPLESFFKILKIDNSMGIHPIFFFMVRKGNVFVPNSDYTPKFLGKILKKLNAFHFEAGLHPSLNVKSLEDLKREKEILEKILSRKVKFVRMHYLRYDPLYTFDMMEKVGFEIDSSVGYPSGFGYRMGTSSPMRVFNWSEKRSGILEVPLVFMDNSEDIYFMKRSLEKVFKNLRKYGGAPAINLHSDFPCRIGYILIEKMKEELSRTNRR